jgi:D-glycero-D-manno-heptose 1,7-bisphosphate phosphatase
MGIDEMNKAVFLDRDGVINEMVLDGIRNEYRPPHLLEEIKFINGSIDAIKMLNKNKYYVFVVSNQPDHAKGKTDITNLYKVKDYIKMMLDLNECKISEYYYCYHHPEGVISGYNKKCECRKPGTLFVEKAIESYTINRENSFFIGDREADILCGKNSALKTIFIENKIYKLGKSVSPDFIADELISAVKIILNTYE